jgi:hypothetical protein
MWESIACLKKISAGCKRLSDDLRGLRSRGHQGGPEGAPAPRSPVMGSAVADCGSSIGSQSTSAQIEGDSFRRAVTDRRCFTSFQGTK